MYKKKVCQLLIYVLNNKVPIKLERKNLKNHAQCIHFFGIQNEIYI